MRPLLLKFIGEDGSMGLRKNQVYFVSVHTDLFGRKPTIKHPIQCPYGSWDAFWKNWKTT